MLTSFECPLPISFRSSFITHKLHELCWSKLKFQLQNNNHFHTKLDIVSSVTKAFSFSHTYRIIVQLLLPLPFPGSCLRCTSIVVLSLHITIYIDSHGIPRVTSNEVINSILATHLIIMSTEWVWDGRMDGENGFVIGRKVASMNYHVVGLILLSLDPKWHGANNVTTISSTVNNKKPESEPVLWHFELQFVGLQPV